MDVDGQVVDRQPGVLQAFADSAIVPARTNESEESEEGDEGECICDPYEWDQEGENVVDYDWRCRCSAGALSRERALRASRAFDVNLLGYSVDGDGNRVDVDGNWIEELS